MPAPLPALASLLQAFRDRDYRVREEAARQLVQIGQPAAEALAVHLATSEAAARALVAMGATAVPVLVDRAADAAHPALGWKAASVLIRIGETAVEPIVARFHDGAAGSDALVYALGEIGGQLGERAAAAVIPELIAVLRAGEPNARLMAAIELEKNALAAQRAAPALINVLTECSEHLGDPRPHDARSGLRREEQRQFRERLFEQVLAALVRIGKPAVPALLQAWRAQPEHSPGSIAVHHALETIAGNDPSVSPHLIGVLHRSPAPIGHAEPAASHDGGPGRHGAAGGPVAAGHADGHLAADAIEGQPVHGFAGSSTGMRYMLIGFVIGLVLVMLLLGAVVFDLRELLAPSSSPKQQPTAE